MLKSFKRGTKQGYKILVLHNNDKILIKWIMFYIYSLLASEEMLS